MSGTRARALVAVVEDNEDSRLLMRILLEEHWEVVDYEDGLAALDGLLASPPDLVLMDVSLPGMDGVNVVGRLRRDPRTERLPVIAVTAHSMTGDRERLIEAGFDDYLAKPIVDEQQLFALIDLHLARAQGEPPG